MARGAIGRGIRAVSTGSSGAGLSGGTGFAGVALLLPDGVVRSILLILAPAITVAISSSWAFFAEEMDMQAADWRIRRQRKRIEGLLDSLKTNPSVSAQLREQAQKDFDALVALQVQISTKRVQAIVER
jgi:hypothetical protein